MRVGYRRETGTLNAYVARNPEPEHLLGCQECDMCSKTDIPIRQIMTNKCLQFAFRTFVPGTASEKKKDSVRRRDNCSLACHPSSLHPFSQPLVSSRSLPRTFSSAFCLKHMLGLSLRLYGFYALLILA